jgi:hypothetical protein
LSHSRVGVRHRKPRIGFTKYLLRTACCVLKCVLRVVQVEVMMIMMMMMIFTITTDACSMPVCLS